MAAADQASNTPARANDRATRRGIRDLPYRRLGGVARLGTDWTARELRRERPARQGKSDDREAPSGHRRVARRGPGPLFADGFLTPFLTLTKVTARCEWSCRSARRTDAARRRRRC